MRSPRLGDFGEHELIRRIRQRFSQSDAVLGIGDDAAIVDVAPGYSIVFCCDLLAENTHFLRNLHPPDSVGYKAVAVNVSDIGAMGGVPLYFVISLAAPPSLELSWFDGFYDGVERACAEFGVSLVGGDSSSAELTFVDVSMIGRIRTGGAIMRSGARPGDGIYITGTLGASSMGLEMLKAGARSEPPVKRHMYPQPRHRVGAAVAGQAHAMIDVSDGLSTDLNHIAVDSKVTAKVYKDKLPRAEGASDYQMLHGGEEYELIIVAPDLPDSIEGVGLTRIGEVIPSNGNHRVLLVERDVESVMQPQGWQHF
jgi:thiamine-monophosphate kinase